MNRVVKCPKCGEPVEHKRDRSKLEEQERELMDKVDELGLIRHVTHEKMSGGARRHKHSLITHETTVELYVGNHWVNVNRDRRIGKIKLFPRAILQPVGIGLAMCSIHDQFNRRIGRLIATSRALNSYINNEASNLDR